eukprot:CAMPEP_0174985650 /NCGR_PEP_ID=MMETSP0004_2-20121128/18462_1 /TAXON_ID=420556 /ORGANISM="Ochromonas sp., Strain CCMP1393" /LENGTH=1154 /DNA_ID=CAMNT_0016238327 /DNA_START=65 /DNA_END=3529 /DNA_ORIENTATION=+
MPTVYYRTEDPVENLKIRVVVREISRSKLYNEDGTKVDAFYNEMVLSWQQKLYSPGEISDYIRNKSSRTGTVAQVEARRHFAKLENEGDAVNDMLDEVMLYTYTDKDNFRAEKPPPLHDPGTQEPYVGAAVRNLGSVHLGSARQRGISQKLFRDRSFKAMHVCLATDVKTEKIVKDDGSGFSLEGWNEKDYFNEHVLCSIRLYQDGLLEVSPMFSTVVEEEVNVTHDECSGLSAFLDDVSAEAGIKKGFRLSSFRVRSSKGSEFEYVIENLNDLLIPYKIEQIYQRKSLNDAIRATETRGAVGFESWKQDPPTRDKTVGVYAELVSAHGFDAENLFVCYEVSLPPAWLLRTGDLSDGVPSAANVIDSAGATSTSGSKSANDPNSKTGGSAVSNGLGQSASTMQLLGSNSRRTMLGAKGGSGGGGKMTMADKELIEAGKRVRTEGDEGMLQGTTHTARVSHPLRCAASLPTLRPLWRGRHLAFAASPGTRFIAGSCFFIVTVLSVVVGISYPIWVVPALVIVFVIGTGPPAGSTPEVVLSQDKSLAGHPHQRRRNASGRSVFKSPLARQIVTTSTVSSSSALSSSSSSLLAPAAEFVQQSLAVFNHLIRFSFDVHDAPDPFQSSSAGMAMAPSAHRPTIVFQIYSSNRWLKRATLEGYGYCHLSDSAGLQDVEIKTWKPVGSITEQMRDFFLGNSLHLKETAFVDSVNKTASSLNRFGVLTRSAGTLRVKVQTVITDPRTIGARDKEWHQELQMQDSSIKVRRTVDDILKSFKSSLGGGAGGNLGLTPSRTSLNSSGGGLAGAFGTPKRPAEGGGVGGAQRPSVSSIMNSPNSSTQNSKLNDILARARAKKGKDAKAKAAGDSGTSTGATTGTNGADASSVVDGGGGVGIAGLIRGRPGGFRPNNNNNNNNNNKESQLDKLRSQLPKSNFGSTPATPSEAATAARAAGVDSGEGAGIATPYDPHISSSSTGTAGTSGGSATPNTTTAAAGVSLRAGAVGANASPSPALAALAAGPGGTGGAGGRGRRVPRLSALSSATGTSATGTGTGTGTPTTGTSGTAGSSGTSGATSATRGTPNHRYANAGQEDQGEEEEEHHGGRLAGHAASAGDSTPLAIRTTHSGLQPDRSISRGADGGGGDDAAAADAGQEEQAPLLS